MVKDEGKFTIASENPMGPVTAVLLLLWMDKISESAVETIRPGWSSKGFGCEAALFCSERSLALGMSRSSTDSSGCCALWQSSLAQ